MSSTSTRQTTITADPNLPTIRIEREFDAPVERVFRAWTDPELFARWIGPAGMGATILEWDATDNGKWRWSSGEGEHVQHFRGSFHTVRPDKIVQTFTWEGMPDGVALETLTFEDLGEGRTRLHATSLCDSFGARDAWLRSGMEVGVNEGYAALDAVLAGDA